MMVRGPSLSLRFATPADAPALFELGSDPDVTRFFSWGPYRRLEQAIAYVDSLAGQRERGERLEFVIVDAGDRPIGVTGLSELSRRDRRAVIGTWLGHGHWGSGANAESKALVLALAFDGLGLERVTAWANPSNVRSIAALERLGFRHEGVLRAWHLHAGIPRDVAVLGLLRDEWRAGPLAKVETRIEGAAPPQFLTGALAK
ncbi:MAG: GNAT family N-acetyltransferase [Thermoleophilaceae bacterium]|nr:GNAT family N-acetyltransferase [Thermoleophilaceae bacterium]